MGKIALAMKAELVNVTGLQPADASHDFHFKIKCTSCQEVSDNFVTINREDTSPISGSRGEANLVMRCKFCKREGSASFDPPQVIPYNAEHNGQFSRIAVFECRGLEPVEFEARDGWKAVGAESGQVFDDIDLTDGDWADYDEKAGNEVSVMDLEFQFSRA